MYCLICFRILVKRVLNGWVDVNVLCLDACFCCLICCGLCVGFVFVVFGLFVSLFDFNSICALSST